MGTTSEKLTYLNNTKQLLKDKINNLGGSIDDNTTFRQYANQLQNVYDNLPKTEYQEGTEITLSNTLKGKLDYENGVVGIGQSSQDSTQGYNLLDLKDGTYIASGVTVVVVNGRATISGTSTSLVTVPILLNNSLTLTNNQIYSLYGFNEAINGDVAFRPISGDGYFQVPFSSVNNAVSLNFTNSTTTIDRITIRVANGVTLNNLICRPMVVVGNDTTKSYEKYTGGQASPNPSYPQTINSVTGNQDVVVSGKNLCDISTKLDNAIINSNSITSGVFTLLYKRLKAGNYTISSSTNVQFVYCFTDDVPTTSTTNISRVVINSTSNTTFNVPNDCYICYRILFYDGSTLDSSVDLNKINSEVQLEQGSTATTYEPYITPKTYQLSLGDIELNSIGNYKDELVYDVDEDKVYKNEKIGKVVINGTETPTLNWDSTNTVRLFYNYSVLPLEAINQRGLCNRLVYNVMWSKDEEGFYCDNNSKHLTIRLPKSVVGGTSSALNEWLSTHNLEIRYVLATPILTEITDTNLHNQVKMLYNAQSLNGTTIVTSSGNLPMIIKIRALKGSS